MDQMKTRETIGKMMRVNRLHRSAVEKRFRELDIHRSQYMLLVHLFNLNGSPSQKEIAAHFNVTPAAIAMSLKKMEKNGFIERTPAIFDNRVNVIKVSEKGKAVMEASHNIFREIDLATIEGITEEENDFLQRIFTKLIDNLIKLGAEDEVCGKMCAKRRGGRRSPN